MSYRITEHASGNFFRRAVPVGPLECVRRKQQDPRKRSMRRKPTEQPDHARLYGG